MTERIRHVDRGKAKDYLKRAEECANAMRMAFENQDWNASVINAVHCAVSTADALCIHIKGVRHAGERHNDAVSLFLSIDETDNEITSNANRLSRMLGNKSSAEYGEHLMGQTDAEIAVKDAERLLRFVKSKIKKEGAQ